MNIVAIPDDELDWCRRVVDQWTPWIHGQPPSPLRPTIQWTSPLKPTSTIFLTPKEGFIHPGVQPPSDTGSIVLQMRLCTYETGSSKKSTWHSRSQVHVTLFTTMLCYRNYWAHSLLLSGPPHTGDERRLEDYTCTSFVHFCKCRVVLLRSFAFAWFLYFFRSIPTWNEH